MKEIVFSSHLMGGLGNQLFQISHTLSQSWKHGVGCYFLPKSETPGNGNQPTKYLDNIFRDITFKDEDVFDVMLRERHFNEANIQIPNDKSIKFWGYFQSSKNFFNFDEKIKNIFGPTSDFKNKILKKYPELNDVSTSIHVRRGDYLTISNILPVVDKSYFDYCLKQIENIGKIYIFTNDSEWVTENLNYENSVIVSDLEDYEELWMMSLCTNNIISNSSFSWWSAFLNRNENKKVFVPNIWFGPNGIHPYNNIYEPSWEKINVYYEDGVLKILT
jgi:hypothetical protein